MRRKGVWLDGLLDACIAMIPKVYGNSTCLGQRPLCVLLVVCSIWTSARMVQLEEWFRYWVPDSVSCAGGGQSFVEAWYTIALEIEEVLAGAVDSHVRGFVADVIKSLDTVDRGILDRVLSSIGLPACCRHAYFEYLAHVRTRFKLASGTRKPWTRDGGIPQGCPFEYDVHYCVVPSLEYADNLKCVCGDPGLLLRAARFTAGCVRLVGQEHAPGKGVLLSTPEVVRDHMGSWALSDEGDRWTVKLDVGDLVGHLDSPGRLVFHAVCAIPSGHFRACLDIFIRWIFPWARSDGQDHVYSMCLPRVVFSRCVLLFFVRSGSGGSLWLVLVLSWVCLMGHKGVILPAVWSGIGSGCEGGIWRFGQLRLLGFTAFWRGYRGAVLAMVPFMLWLPVLFALGLSGILPCQGGGGKACVG